MANLRKSKRKAPPQIKTELVTQANAMLPDATEDQALYLAMTHRGSFSKYLLAVAGVTQADITAVVNELRGALLATETKYFAHQGQVVSQRQVISWEARLAAIEKWLRLLDLYSPKSDKPGHGAAHVLKVEVDLAPDLKRLRSSRDVA